MLDEACVALPVRHGGGALLKRRCAGARRAWRWLTQAASPAQWMLEAADYTQKCAAAATRMSRALPPEKGVEF